MACFIVPATEAIATTLLSKVIKKKKQETEKTDVSLKDFENYLKQHLNLKIYYLTFS